MFIKKLNILLVIAGLVLSAGFLFADEVDDALNLEASLNEAKKGRSVKPLPVKKKTSTSSRRVTPRRKSATTAVSINRSSPAYKASEFIDALKAKQKEVDAAKKEISRLKGLIKKILEANRRERGVMYYNMGCVYKAGRLYKKAESEFLKAVDLIPDDAALHYNLGILFDDDLKQKKKAKHHYKRFLELAPGDRDAAKVQEWLLAIP